MMHHLGIFTLSRLPHQLLMCCLFRCAWASMRRRWRRTAARPIWRPASPGTGCGRQVLSQVLLETFCITGCDRQVFSQVLLETHCITGCGRQVFSQVLLETHCITGCGRQVFSQVLFETFCKTGCGRQVFSKVLLETSCKVIPAYPDSVTWQVLGVRC
jgi:hypothetical protein